MPHVALPLAMVQPAISTSQVVEVCNLSNEEFLNQYAQPGRVGLSGGYGLIDHVITHAQRHLIEEKQPSLWSHAFLCEGRRIDRQHWIIESDLQFDRKHIRLGVQENRLSKYFSADTYPTLAILDFQLPQPVIGTLLAEGLEMVSSHVRYSLRELVGTLLAMRLQRLRAHENLLAQKKSVFCSAFVQHLFAKGGVQLAPGLGDKNSTPEDISRTPVPHVTYLLRRPRAPRKLTRLRQSLHQSLRPKKDKGNQDPI